MWQLFLSLKEWLMAKQLPTIPPIVPKPVNPDEWLDKLIVGLIYAESRGDVNCVGDKDIPESKGGKAYGILQIRSGVRGEVNALWGTRYVGENLLGEDGAELSKMMCQDYMLKVLPQYKSYKSAIKAGIPRDEVCAKSWNGGAGWYLQSKKEGYGKYARGLEMYWDTVSRHMG